jgi:biotin synthase-related radical SAM superfamily protein
MKMVRVSLGSAVKLGLKNVKVDCLPNIVYVMTSGQCRAHCLFCSQCVAEDHLSRIQWPEYPLDHVLSALTGERVCIQCLNYKGVFTDVLKLVKKVNTRGNSISVSAQPFSKENIAQLASKIDRIAINLDCATSQLFQKIKPYYSWDNHVSTLVYARKIFGPFKVTSHLIVGLGETEQELVKTMKFLYENQVYCSLFAFTPIPGTPLSTRKKPSVKYYRRMQVVHYLMYEKGVTEFEYKSQKVQNLNINNVPAEAFVTRGCPGCNRPYYTETPRNLYNYPYIPEKEMDVIMKSLE